MMETESYHRPESLEEAHELLQQDDVAVVGGGAFLRLSRKHFSRLLDLSELELEYIREAGDNVEIGAYTTLRELETSAVMQKWFDGMIPQSVASVVGVQMRNIVTVGGTVAGQYGFSDLLTALLALDCRVVQYRGEEQTLEEFLDNKRPKNNIVEKIILKKEKVHGSFRMVRNSLKDFAILNAAVTRKDTGYRIAVGSRPAVAGLALEAMKFIKDKDMSYDLASTAGNMAAEELRFGGNTAGSSEYRKELCKTLVKRGLLEVSE